MTSMNDTPSEIKRQSPLEEFEEILGFVQTTFRQGQKAHDLEAGLWEGMRKLGHGFYGAWLACSAMAMPGIGSSWTVAARCIGSIPSAVDPFERTPDAVLDALLHDAPAGQSP